MHRTELALDPGEFPRIQPHAATSGASIDLHLSSLGKPFPFQLLIGATRTETRGRDCPLGRRGLPDRVQRSGRFGVDAPEFTGIKPDAAATSIA